ncbi:TolB family protein [Sorangium sp. So ce1000]|uniref:TolB family protein n=1 Tax=Sorangium sp. So ce1000 TaxID=3133325 RepID=UPI003F5E647A
MAFHEMRRRPPDGEGENIYTMPLDGGEPVVLASDAGMPEHLAQDAENLYWTGGAATNKVYKVAKSGGEVTVIADNEAEPAGIAVDAAFVYWANTGDGGVFKAPIAGGQKTLIHQGSSMAGLALRGSTLFSTDMRGNRSVNAHDLESNRTVVLAFGQAVPWRVLAPEGQGVFWSNAGDYRYQGQVASYRAP